MMSSRFPAHALRRCVPVVVVAALLVSPRAVAGAAWSTREPMPSARADLAVTADRAGRLYALGGWTGPLPGAVNRRVERYDPLTDSWVRRAPMPLGRVEFEAVLAGRRIFALGGYAVAHGVATARVDAYDVASNAWSTVAPMPVAQSDFAAATGLDGRIYVFGGVQPNSGGLLANDVYIYSPHANTWTSGTPMPTRRRGAEAVTAPDGKIYVMGGYNSRRSPEYLAKVEVYDPGSDSWTTERAMPTARTGFAAALAADGDIYVIGGYGGGEILDSVEVLDLTTGRWSPGPAMPAPRAALEAGVGGSSIFAIGGAGPAGDSLRKNEVLSNP